MSTNLSELFLFIFKFSFSLYIQLWQLLLIKKYRKKIAIYDFFYISKY